MSSWGEMIIEFAADVKRWKQQLLNGNGRDPLFQFPPVIVDSAIDHASLSAAWIICEHTGTIERFCDGRWCTGAFTYTVWLHKYSRLTPRQVFTKKVIRQRGEKELFSALEVATDVDRVAVDRNWVYVRDIEVLRQSRKPLDLPSNWLMFSSRSPPVLARASA